VIESYLFKGVVGIIVLWNYLLILVVSDVIFVLIVGNVVVFKFDL